MEKNSYLNYTHGTILQSLCEDLLAGQDKKTAAVWIRGEQNELRKKQPAVWDIPVSVRKYDQYLTRIEHALCSEDYAEEIRDLQKEITDLTRKKIHALFLTQETFCWPSLESVFAAAVESEEYEVALVYTPYFHTNFTEQVDYYETYQQLGLPVLRHNEYNLPEESPDVVFLIKPYGNVPERYTINNIETAVPRIVYIPYGMEITTDLIRYGFQFYGHYRAWRHCAYGDVVKAYGKQYGYRNGENIAVWGHPKADHYLDPEYNRNQIPEEWKQRIAGRKTILWTPHHLVDLNEGGTGTWMIWGDYILEEARKHPDLFFIVRPHPLMMGALVNTGSLSQKQVDKIRQKIDSAENMVWDTYDDYRIAFDAADAILTDGTTFSVEFLYTKKPIILTPRNMDGFYIYEEMLRSYYVINRIEDIATYMDMIARGEDPLKERRHELYKKTFFVPEQGTVGEHIVKQVKFDLEKECREMNLPISAPENRGCEEKEPVDVSQFPLMSILVLCYKNQELLFGMLDTIFAQDYPRIQLIVSDDGSEDFDIERIQRYIDLHQCGNIEQVIVRTNEVNMRTVPHIHAAMQYVKGEYLVFTAADDRFEGRTAISMYVEQFLRKPHLNWLVAKCRVTSPDYKRTLHYLPAQVDEPFFAAEDAPRLFSRWSRRGMAIPCCMAFKTKAIEMVGGFDLDYLFMEDWPLVLKLLRSGNAPIFCNEVTAIHSAGGVTNSNQRYGKEIRRLFYEDKYTIFRKEVIPNMDLLLPEDKKAFKHYMREIMERHYFLNIDWPETSAKEKVVALLKKPMGLIWLLELKLAKRIDFIPKKKLFALSQLVLLVSMFFLNAQGDRVTDVLFRTIGYLDLAAGLGLMVGSGLLCLMQRYITKKAKLRKYLVN